jgi:S-(hydroxymethyl)glutathione dehydrogenase / alcohol dehydrogenase
MKAAVCYAFGEPLKIENVRIDAPAEGEVKVRIAAAAVCHSDVHLIRGEWGGELPVVPGHEAAGIVEEIGFNVTGVEPGNRVVVSLLRSCGRCFQCGHGAPQLCEGSFALNSECRLHDEHGTALQHGIRVAAFAEWAIVDQSQVVRVPAGMPLDRAALLGCGVITGVGAVMNTARVRAGQSVVIIGTGGVGINSIQGARLAAAAPIIAVDRVESKLDLARSFGATHAFNADRADIRTEVRKLTSGRGADYVFVTVGVPALVAQAASMIRPGGTVVLVGMPEWKATAAVRMADLVWNEQRVIGSRLGSTRLNTDIPRLADLYLEGRLELDALISRRYPLEQINEAITEMQTGAVLRNVIVLDESRLSA